VASCGRCSLPRFSLEVTPPLFALPINVKRVVDGLEMQAREDQWFLVRLSSASLLIMAGKLVFFCSSLESHHCLLFSVRSPDQRSLRIGEGARQEWLGHLGRDWLLAFFGSLGQALGGPMSHRAM
jgi:hypothetical protein